MPYNHTLQFRVFSSHTLCCWRLLVTLPPEATVLGGMELIQRLILFVAALPSCDIKFLVCKRHLVIETKSSPTTALEPLPGADLAILSIKLTTEPMSFTTELKAFGDIEYITFIKRSKGGSVVLNTICAYLQK